MLEKTVAIGLSVLAIVLLFMLLGWTAPRCTPDAEAGMSLAHTFKISGC